LGFGVDLCLSFDKILTSLREGARSSGKLRDGVDRDNAQQCFTILIIDDSPEILETLSNLLRPNTWFLQQEPG